MGDRTCQSYDVICKRSTYDVERARKMYVYEKMSAKAIADDLGCSEPAVLDWVRHYGWRIWRKELQTFINDVKKQAELTMHRELLKREMDNIDPDPPEMRSDRLLARMEALMLKEIEDNECEHCGHTNPDPDTLKKHAETMRILVAAKDKALTLAKNEGKLPSGLRQVNHAAPDENDEASDEELEELRRIRAGEGGNQSSPQLLPDSYERGEHLSPEQLKRKAYEESLERGVVEHDERLAQQHREERAANEQ